MIYYFYYISILFHLMQETIPHENNIFFNYIQLKFSEYIHMLIGEH